MTKGKNTSVETSGSYTLGRKAFAAISAVEGLKLTSASKKRLQTLQSSDLSQAERRQAVIQAYAGTKRP